MKRKQCRLFLLVLHVTLCFDSSKALILPYQRQTWPDHAVQKHDGGLALTRIRQPIQTIRTSTLSATHLKLYPTAGASIALLGSSLVGMQVERWIPSGGILGTLGMAALLANTCAWVPNAHTLYNLCWSLFLPGSLALTLLAYQKDPGKGPSTRSSMEPTFSIASSIRRVGGPFAMASIGSLLGCWLSFQCALKWNWLPIQTARAATGCLAASYIGGSVNFFAAARILKAPAEILSSMATADLIAMVLYFSILSSTLEWKWLKSRFGKQENLMETAAVPSESTINAAEPTSSSWRSKALASIPLLSLTWLLVQLANQVDRLVGRWIPGTACAVIAIVAPLLNSRLPLLPWWRPAVGEAAGSLADFFFLAFFASIGIGANLSSALQMGPACFGFSILSLAVHLSVAVVGSMLLPGDVELEDVWIASNAAIGGPATAAAFCNRMKNNPAKLRGRTLAATVWGVVGYAVGTSLGVGLYRAVGGTIL